jgi:gamma-glutamylputrescine oxidase
MSLNDTLNMAGSYYAATAAPFADRPSLGGETHADLVVVGGGTTGLSTALHAAQAGLSVVVLEGGRIGWGASGRNGGQMIPGLRKGAPELVAAYGPERARALFDLSLSARDLVLGLIQTHGIACDLRLTGHLTGAVKPSDQRRLAAEAECLQTVMAYPHAVLLDAAEAREQVDTPYKGGLLDRQGGHMHPLNYTLGLARAAEAAGAVLHEQSLAVELERTGGGVRVATAGGAVRARQAVLAGDALLQGLAPRVNSRIMPVANYVVTTEPLDDAESLIPADVAVSDTRFVVNYYRRTPDGRLLFGGGERYTPDPPADFAGFVRPFMEAVFPQVRGRRIDHAWGGPVSVTTSRLPHLGRDGPVLFAHGYSGLGVILSTLAGKLLAEEIGGSSQGFDLFAGVEPRAFPGGVALRGPLYVLGMLWYAMRDRVG